MDSRGDEHTTHFAQENVFGTTVFGYIRDTKMEQAKKMLQSQQVSINEVSDKIGYKNSQHFSTAFKRKYGISPSQVRKLM